MRIVLITDAWKPQLNGVVRTLGILKSELERLGHQPTYITPDLFRTIPCPTYPEIRLSLAPSGRLARMIEEVRPEAIHISTEGPLGWAARALCRRRGLPFSTAYHTKFPEYIYARARIPLSLSYGVLRRFHGASSSIMVATPSIEEELRKAGFSRMKRWSRGVDTTLFRPHNADELAALAPEAAAMPKPLFTYVGRVAVEKNVGAFLALDLPGSKMVVGDGPMLDDLRRKYPGVLFAGARQGAALGAHYAASSVFVFPSRTDTFGLVMLEAMASGLPVAAYPVPGPLDVLVDPRVGVMDQDLGKAARAALELSREDARNYALTFSWESSARQFLSNLAPFDASVWEGVSREAPAAA
ncbi:MAG TPA: glycosyltransferase family 1 protein [Magnetospirillaceae bacterium]|jgi:glycosyltransferase involved in cell wall biosynthesis